MTYSILAYDPLVGHAGVGVVSGSIAVGSRVPWAKHGIGVVVTQAYTNPSLGPLILELLPRTSTAEEALRRALEHDPSPAHRQVAVIDYRGDIAVHDGPWSPSWHGYIVHPNEPVVCIASLVESRKVCENAMDTFIKTKGSLADRIVSALESAHKSGGDRRGDKSASLIVVGQTEHMPYYDRIVDLRVDYSNSPLRDLRRLLHMYNEGY